MNRLKKRLLSFLMATVVAVSFSMSAVAEEVVANEEDVLIPLTEKVVDEHEHAYLEELISIVPMASHTCVMSTPTQQGSYVTNYTHQHPKTVHANGKIDYTSCSVSIYNVYNYSRCMVSGCMNSTTTFLYTDERHVY